jgi:1-acyl-sn-glycerol-3-phosphate acyltransferase
MNLEMGAMVFLLAALAAWVAWSAQVLLRKPLTPMQNFLLLIDRLLTAFLWRTTAKGRPELPADRGCVMVCNHRSSIDPFFVQRSINRPIHWMVAREFVVHPLFRWFLATCEVIPVNRGGIDTAATRLALRYVRQGGIVGMFPEGRINMTENLFLPGRPGAALVAIKTRAMVIPCYIEGAPYHKTAWSPLLMPAHVKVYYGSPIDSAPFADRIAAGEDETAVTAELLLTTMKALACLAGRPDFEPQLAGRKWKPTEAQIAADVAENESRRKSRRSKMSR